MKTELTPEQKSLVDKLPGLQMEMHINMDNEGMLQHGLDFQGVHITRIIKTPKDKNGKWGVGVATWHLSDDKQEYKSAVDMLDALRKRVLIVVK